jgi:hypothetical protein
MAVKPEMKVWRVLRLGVYGDMQELRAALHMNHIFCQDPYTRQLLNVDKSKLAAKGTQVELYDVTLAQLGFTDRDIISEGNFGTISPEQIYARAADHGLVPCPFETGPYACLRVPIEEVGKEGVNVAIQQVVNSYRPYNAFRLCSFLGQYRLSGDIGARSVLRPLRLSFAELLRQRWIFTCAKIS